MEFIFDFNYLFISVAVIVAIVLAPKFIQMNRITSSKSMKGLQKLDQEYIEELEYKLKQIKNTLNKAEQGPRVTGDISELSSLLPDIVGQFSKYAPKWLQPILSNPESSKWIMEYVEKNPEKASELFAKFIRKKGDKSDKIEVNGQEIQGL